MCGNFLQGPLVNKEPLFTMVKRRYYVNYSCRGQINGSDYTRHAGRQSGKPIRLPLQSLEVCMLPV